MTIAEMLEKYIRKLGTDVHAGEVVKDIREIQKELEDGEGIHQDM